MCIRDRNIEKYTKLEEAKEIFDRYLPYAIAFGLERSWISKFSQVDTPAPPWYIPDYRYPTGPRRVGRAAPAPSSEGAGLPSLGPSLESASQSLFNSLNSISDGLLSTLESAASTFTSAPSSKGGGWSGGGGGGGGCLLYTSDAADE